MIKQLRYLCTLLLMAVAGVAWGYEVTFDATVDVTEDAASYQTTEKSYTASDGSVWKANGYGAKAYTNIVIGKGGANYLETPEVAGVISSVTVTWSGNASYYLALQTTSGEELAAKQNVSGGQEYTFNVTGSYSQLRLVGRRASGTSNAAATITKVVVTYSASSLQENDLTLTPSTLSLDLGGTSSAQISNSGNANGEITWTSSNTAVATVDANGNVTAVEIGKATITAEQAASDTYKGGNATCEVTVGDSRYSVSSLVFEAKCNGLGTADDGNTWTITSDGTESTYDATSGIHYGTNNASVTYLQLASSSNNGTIKKILVNARDAQENATISVTVGGTAFTCTTDPKATNLSSDYVFTGSAKGEIIVRIERTESMTKALYVKNVVVYYEPSTLADPELTFSETEFTVDAGATFTAPTLTTNPEGLAVTYSSSDVDLATVDEETGAVTIGNNPGTVTITARFAGNDEYNPATASYTITINSLLQNIAALTALEDAGEYTVTLTDALVTYVNGTKGYIEDASGAVMLYGAEAVGELKAGDKITGTATVTYTIYNGLPELTTMTLAEGYTKTENNVVTPTVVTLAELNGDNYSSYISRYVKIEEATVVSAFTDKNSTIKQGEASIVLRDQNKTATLTTKVDDVVTVTAHPSIFNTTKQIAVYEQNQIVVKQDDRDAAEIAFNPETLTITQGDKEYTNPQFLNPNNIAASEISFTSSNANIADWDDSGLVLGSEVGSATITATFEGNITYKPATATLVVTVNENLNFVDVVIGSGIYQKVSSASDLEAGKRYLIVGYKASETAYYAYNGFDEDTSKKYGLAATVTVNNDRIDNTESAATPIVLQKRGNNWFLMDGDNFLAYNLSAGTEKNNNLFAVSEATDDGTSWIIDFESENGYLITSAYNTERSLEFNSDRFACYKHSQQDVVLYKELQENPVLIGDVNKDGHVTIADVTALVNILLNKDTTAYDLNAANVDGANGITVADVEALVNIILEKKN